MTLWAQSLVECIAMSNTTKRELDAVTRLLSKQTLHKTDPAWLEHMLNTNPMMKLDELDIEEFHDFIKDNCKVM